MPERYLEADGWMEELNDEAAEIFEIDLNSKAWVCRFCKTVYDFPSYYDDQEWDTVGDGCQRCSPFMETKE